MKFTPEMLAAMRGEMDAALAAVGKKHGVTFKTGNCSFSPSLATYKIAVTVPDEEGVSVAPETALLRELAHRFGFTPEHLNQIFTLPGSPRRYTLHGYNNRARGKPFIVACLDNGGHYCITVLALKRALGIKDWETRFADEDNARRAAMSKVGAS